MSDTTGTTNVESLEAMISRCETSRRLAEEAQLAYEGELAALAAAHGSTYTDPHTGKVFQIRHRVDSKQGRPITYLCALKAEPKTWLTGRAKKAVTADATSAPAAMAAAAASVVPETGGATVIE